MELEPRHMFIGGVFVVYIIMLAGFWAFDPLPLKYQIPMMLGGGMALLLMALYSFARDRRR